MSDWQNRITGYKQVPVNELLANPSNARRHPAKQREALRGSLDTIGWIAPVIVNSRTGYVIDGHARIEEALTKDDTQLLPVVEVDLSPEEEAQALASYDFITYLAEYDREQLEALLHQVQSDDARIQQLMSDLASENALTWGEPDVIPDAPDAQIDRAEELNQQWQVQSGDLWIIPSITGEGEHRLLCGDSTNADDVARLMGDDKANLGLTDPPYGVDMSKGFEGFEGFGGFGPPIARKQYTDDWDAERPPKEAFDNLLKNVNSCIVFGGNFFADLLPQSTHWIVWDKLNTMPTYGDCELAWTNIDRKSVKKFTYQYNGLIGKEKERYHPTQKPVGLFSELLNGYSDEGLIILDTYGGSGTTMVACEQLSRQCRMIEIEPKYCAVILERMAQMGCTPRRATHDTLNT